LRVNTQTIKHVDDSLQTIIDDMFETMYAAPGVGLAAPQIGLDLRLSVIDVSTEKNRPLVLINPEIIQRGEEVRLQEGCLSVPDCYDYVKRAKWVKMQALDRDGKAYTLEAEDLLAQCIQHELDHLDGRLYIDQLSALKRRRMQNKVNKYKRRLKAEA
jgi:peptide deformylase